MTSIVLAAILTAGCSRRSDSSTATKVVALGSLHSGTTMRQVVAEFGQPELATTNSGVIIAARYQKLGLDLLAPKGVVLSVSVLPPCTLRTKEGIGIGSSRAAVIRAYGKPTFAHTPAAGCEDLAYTRLGFVCALEDGKVGSMTIIFHTTK